MYSLQEIFNIQLLYNINQTTEQDSQDSKFHLILLHNSLEHLLSDFKNIKESLYHITNYIKNKCIDCTKANDIPDLNGIDKVVWNFISAIYKLSWNILVTNKDNRIFKQQVMSKFTPKVQETRKTTKGNKTINKLVSFAKLPPLILIKTSKEINKISKFFKKNTKLTEKKNIRKSYMQALSPKTSRIFKIKETFPKLQTNKIDNIYKIINNVEKPKSKLNMTTKDLSKKQVIIPISDKNKTKFIEFFTAYITTLNRALKNIKLEVMADFVYMNQTDITIVTNKVASSLNLQTIDKYIKNTNYIDLDKVETSQLLQSKLYMKIIDILYLPENCHKLHSAYISTTSGPIFTN